MAGDSPSMTRSITQPLPKHLQAKLSAQRKEVSVQLVAGALALFSLIGAGLLMGPINTIRKERQFVINPETIAGLPPELELMNKLGTFRALAIDWAAIRAERLKMEGKTYEALELHKAVCRLAPRMPKLWVFAAWNMAYNISVSQYSPEQRWQWVQNGIKLLRDEGIQYNPRSVTLYKELAWIYWHKIGDVMDDEHRNYKRALAVDMERVLGPPPITLTDEEYFDWFREVADAPTDFDAFLRRDVAVKALAEQFEQLGLGPDENLLDFVARTIRPETQAWQLLKDRDVLDSTVRRRLEILQDPANAAARDRLLGALRSKILREKFKLDPSRMLRLMVERYGPLDWRNAYSHTVYWATLGTEVAEGYANVDRNDEINTARNVLFALHSMVMGGRIVLWPNFDEPFDSYIEFSTDPRLIPYLYDEYLRLGKKYFGDREDFVEGTAGPVFRNGFVSAMENWIQVLYFEGGEKNLALAENFYAWLRKNNPHPDGSTQERYTKTVQEFVLGDVLDQLHTHRAAAGLVRTFIKRALKELGLGLTEAGVSSLRHARLAHRYWEKDAADIKRTDRLRLPPIRIMLRDQIEEMMREPQLAALFKVRLWNALPVEQRQMTFDRLRPYFEQLCASQRPPWDVEKALPEPPGMEEYRKTAPEAVLDVRPEDVDYGERYKR
ncbi:MAG: hypothetical protein J5J06_00895 [Phycisphaerae bacterium]|nr:hypothetical protein [Phycisphaerae bacterium]